MASVNIGQDLEKKLLQMKRMIDEQKSLQDDLKQDLLEQQRLVRQDLPLLSPSIDQANNLNNESNYVTCECVQESVPSP